MNSFGEPFIITVNLSEVINGKAAKFTMLIDCKKMTIVYEVTEWIRWMFSITECFFLVHDDSIIHDLEDVKILAFLKSFEVRSCTKSECVHKRYMFRNLLEKIDFYAYWNQKKIPKLFMEKLQSINQKLHLAHNETQRSETSCSLTCQGLSSSPLCKERMQSPIKQQTTGFPCVEYIESVTKNEKATQIKEHKTVDLSCNKEPKNSIVLKMLDTSNDKLSFTGNEYKESKIGNKYCSLENNMAKKRFKNLSQNNEQQSDSFVDLMNSSNDDNINAPNKVETYKNSKKITFPKKNNKYTSPFALAGVVMNLRNELANQIENSTRLFSTQHLKAETLHADTIKDENYFDTEQDNLRKKRKRVRKHKSKKKTMEPLENFLSAKPLSFSNMTPVEKKTSTHIRFKSSSSSSSGSSSRDEKKISSLVSRSQSKTSALNFPCHPSNDEPSNARKHRKIEETEMVDNFNVTTPPKQSTSNQSLNNTADCTPATNTEEIHVENGLIIFSDPSVDKCQKEAYDSKNSPDVENEMNGYFFDAELDLLKSKYPFPVAFERFY